MSVDMESRLREALHARAAGVEPDRPRTWELVQARLRRSRQRRLALAGVAAAAAVVLAAAVAVPAVTGGGTMIRFDPPVADQPGDDSARQGDPAPDAGPGGAVLAEEGPPRGPVPALEPCHDPATVAAVWTRGGDLWGACANGNALPLAAGEATDRNPAVSPAGDAVVFERVEDGAHPVLVHRGFGEGDREVVLGGGRLPAFAPDGRLAWIQDAGDGTAVLQAGEPFGEPEFEAGVPTPAEDFRSLSWEPAGDRVIYGVATPDGLAVWSLDLAAGEFRLLLEPDAGYLAVAPGPDGALAALRSAAAGTVELVVLEGAVPAGGEVAETLVLASDTLVDAGGALFLSPAGHARADVRPWDPAIRWSPGSEPSWLLGDGTSLYLVTAAGEASHLEGGVDGAAANPAADLAEAARQRQAEEARRAELERVEEARRSAQALQEEARERARELAEATTVEEARRQIQESAAAGDVPALRGLMAPDFTSSFGAGAGRGEAAAHLEANPRLLEALRDLLDLSHGVVDAGGRALYVWPRAHALDPGEWTAGDLAELRSLGATEEQIRHWRAGEGYTGLRAGIDADGRWHFLVEGD